MPKIGVLDSGVGGLSVLREIHRILPQHSTIYYADQAHVPYGTRPHAEIDCFVDSITRFLLGQGVDVVVLACHAASAASLQILRGRYPQVPFVGLEPAIKPAVLNTRSGVVGVLTTQATADGALYRRLLQRYGGTAQIITQAAPELVTLVESGQTTGAAIRPVVAYYVEPLLRAGVDQIVLACTHFPFLAEVIRDVAGDTALLVDPGAAVARQVQRVLPDSADAQPPSHRYLTSADADTFSRIASALIGDEIAADAVVGTVRDRAD